MQVVTPVALSPTDYTNALRLGWDDLEDCLVALCAQSARADYLVTRDTKGFSRSLVPVSFAKANGSRLWSSGMLCVSRESGYKQKGPLKRPLACTSIVRAANRCPRR